MKLVTTTVVLTAAAALVGLPTLSWGEDFLFPESWEGVWETTYTEYDCVTNDINEEGVDVNTICSGDPFLSDFGEEYDMECTGFITDTGMDLSCSFSEEVFPGCTVTFSYVTEAAISEDSVTGTATTSITYEGMCFVDDECSREEFSSQRLQEDPGCSGTPVTAQSWGVLKGHYR